MECSIVGHPLRAQYGDDGKLLQGYWTAAAAATIWFLTIATSAVQRTAEMTIREIADKLVVKWDTGSSEDRQGEGIVKRRWWAGQAGTSVCRLMGDLISEYFLIIISLILKHSAEILSSN